MYEPSPKGTYRIINNKKTLVTKNIEINDEWYILSLF
jgi:hypothetical protein